jgi:uncharacterized protein (DUF1684 family)
MPTGFKRNFTTISFVLLGMVGIAAGFYVRTKEKAEAQTAYEHAITAFRKNKDHFLRADSSSPVPNRALFEGLSYYPIKPAWLFRLRLLPLPDTSAVWLPTTAGTQMAFRRLGWVQMPKPSGGVFPLVIYQAIGAKEAVLLFTDGTSGAETPDIGRYLDIELGKGAYITLDFNRVYAPFCTYNPSLACPLPPKENALPFPVPAGERLVESLLD